MTLLVMAWKRFFTSLLRNLYSDWSNDNSFPTPGLYVELRLAMPCSSSRGFGILPLGDGHRPLLAITGNTPAEHE